MPSSYFSAFYFRCPSCFACLLYFLLLILCYTSSPSTVFTCDFMDAKSRTKFLEMNASMLTNRAESHSIDQLF